MAKTQAKSAKPKTAAKPKTVAKAAPAEKHEAVARARMLRMAPRKMRLVADLIRGKKVSDARAILRFTVKGASPLIRKVLEAAVANAESKAAETRSRVDTDDMVVKLVTIDGGPSLRGFIGAPRGRALRIRQRTSHVRVVIGD
jgi:large subunit ribosomal protein L22